MGAGYMLTGVAGRYLHAGSRCVQIFSRVLRQRQSALVYALKEWRHV